jgi:hypothetical protein
LKKIIDKRSRKLRDYSPDRNEKPGTLESYFFLEEIATKGSSFSDLEKYFIK